jgi:hypothetical protein
METALAQDVCLVCGEGVAHYEGNGDDSETFRLDVEAFALQCYIHDDCAARALPLLPREVDRATRLLGIEGATLRSCSTCGKESLKFFCPYCGAARTPIINEENRP